MPHHLASTFVHPLNADGAETWSDIDLALVEDGRRAAPLFPLDLLPQPWRAWASETARSAGAPVDYVAQALLGAVAGLCGAGTLVRITPAWSEPLVLWQVLIGRASSGKSPALASMRALIGLLEREPKAGVDEAPTRIVVSDLKHEALASSVAANPGGVVLWRDGPTAWLADLGPSWLDSWRGAPSMPESASVAVSVLGTIRPEPLMAALEMADAAVAARFLYTWPDPPPYCALVERRSPNNDLALDRLRKIRCAARAPINPLILPLDVEGAKAFDGFLAALHRDLGHAEGLEADWLGKGSGTVARLAGILQLLAWSGSDTGAMPTHVGASAVQAAIELWRDYFRLHALFVFERGGPDDLLRQARRVVHWLRVNRRSETSREDVRCHALYRAVKAARADLVIGRLYAGNVLRPVRPLEPRPAHRPAERWESGPVFLTALSQTPQSPGNGQVPDAAWFCGTRDGTVAAPETAGNSSPIAKLKRRHGLCWRHDHE
jgi:hypothetical protein